MPVSRYNLTDFPADVYTDCIGDSLFASPAFMELWQCQGGTPVVWSVEENNVCIAILPGVEFGVTGLKRFQSMPDGLYTRIYYRNRPQGVETTAILNAIAKAGYSKVYLFDLYNSLRETKEYASTEQETSIIDISLSDWQPPDKKLQSEIRKAEREGISIASINPEQHLEPFLVLMRDTEARHGRAQKYSDDFFHGLAELSTTDKRVHWLWCEHEGVGAASHIFLIEGDMALHWQVYFDKQFSFLKPNQYILYTQAEQLRACGVNRLNLGASLPEAEGLKAYKDKWGGTTTHYRSLERKSGVGKLF